MSQRPTGPAAGFTRRSLFAAATLAAAILPALPFRRSLRGAPGRGRSSGASKFELLETRQMLSGNFPSAGDNSLAYDASGNLHVAYYDANAKNLKYVRQNQAGMWSDPQTID